MTGEDMLARAVYDSDSVRHLNQVGLGISALTAALLSMSGTQLYVWIGETGAGTPPAVCRWPREISTNPTTKVQCSQYAFRIVVVL